MACNQHGLACQSRKVRGYGVRFLDNPGLHLDRVHLPPCDALPADGGWLKTSDADGGLIVCPDVAWQKTDGQHRALKTGIYQPGCFELRCDGLWLLGETLENGFKIDRNRIGADRKDILHMHIRGAEQVEKRQPCARRTEVLVHFRGFTAFTRLDEFLPAIADSSETLRAAERQDKSALADEIQKFADHSIAREILWLVDDAVSAAENGNQHRASAFVRIGKSEPDPGQDRGDRYGRLQSR